MRVSLVSCRRHFRGGGKFYNCCLLFFSLYLGDLHIFSRLSLCIVESPIITDEAISLLKQFCQVTIVIWKFFSHSLFAQGETGALAGVNLMKDLVMKRPTKQLNFLNSILEFCSHEDTQVRETALGTVLSLYDRGELTNIIEYSIMYPRYLLLARPPDMLFGEDRGRCWTKEIIKVCNFYLYFSTCISIYLSRSVCISTWPCCLGTRKCSPIWLR